MPADVVRRRSHLDTERSKADSRLTVRRSQMLNEHIQFEGAGAIARARFNRPEKNAITESMYDNLREAIENSEAEADPAVRILVIASHRGQLHRLYALPSKRARVLKRSLFANTLVRTGGCHGTSILIVDPPTNCGKPR